jgi:hypothetical protein
VALNFSSVVKSFLAWQDRGEQPEPRLLIMGRAFESRQARIRMGIALPASRNDGRAPMAGVRGLPAIPHEIRRLR